MAKDKESRKEKGITVTKRNTEENKSDKRKRKNNSDKR